MLINLALRAYWVVPAWFRLNFVKNLCLNYNSRNLVLFNFRGDNASLPTRFHESQYDGWSSRMPTIVSIYSKHVGCDLRLLNRTDCDVWLYPKKLWLFMFEMLLISGITDGWQGGHPPTTKLNVKTGSLPSLYFGIYYSFHFRRLLFFLRFSECFPVISGFCITVQYQVTVFPSAKFPPGSSYVTAPDQSKIVLQIRAMCRASSSILQ